MTPEQWKNLTEEKKVKWFMGGIDFGANVVTDTPASITTTTESIKYKLLDHGTRVYNVKNPEQRGRWVPDANGWFGIEDLYGEYHTTTLEEVRELPEDQPLFFIGQVVEVIAPRVELKPNRFIVKEWHYEKKKGSWKPDAYNICEQEGTHDIYNFTDNYIRLWKNRPEVSGNYQDIKTIKLDDTKLPTTWLPEASNPFKVGQRVKVLHCSDGANRDATILGVVKGTNNNDRSEVRLVCNTSPETVDNNRIVPLGEDESLVNIGDYVMSLSKREECVYAGYVIYRKNDNYFIRTIGLRGYYENDINLVKLRHPVSTTEMPKIDLPKSLDELKIEVKKTVVFDPECPKCKGTGRVVVYPNLEPEGYPCKCDKVKKEACIVGVSGFTYKPNATVTLRNARLNKELMTVSIVTFNDWVETVKAKYGIEGFIFNANKE